MAARPSTMSARRRRPVTALLFAGAIALAAVAQAACSRHASSPAVPDPHASAAFLSAWRRSLVSTWALDATFERRVGKARIAYDIRQAQRPPDHLRVAGGTVDASLHGQVLACSTGSDGRSSCRAAPAPPFDDEVAAQMKTLGSYFAAPAPLYRAHADKNDCFTLTLLRPILAPPYGQTARFCFDRATGAPVRTEITRSGSTDLTVATSVRARVTDADLTPPPAAGQ